VAKLSKKGLTKQEAAKLMEWRRREKQETKLKKQLEQRQQNITKSLSTQPLSTPDEDIAKYKPDTRSHKPDIIPISDGSTAFVLGNGTSREPINPENLKSYGKVYACNAIYRTFDPDYLVAVDVKMILELHKAGYHKKNPNIWTNPQKSISRFKEFNFFNPSKGWSSGPTALWLAAQHKYETIYILGFDYKGLKDGQKFNNMYADTPNYKKSTDGATFFGNWMRQTTNVIKENPHIKFVRVIAPDNYRPEELNKFENFSTILIEDFQKIYEN